MQGNRDLWLAGAGVTVLTVGLIAAGLISGDDTRTRPTGLSESETRQIEAVVRNYLMERPEVLYEALRNLETHQDTLKSRASTEAIAKARKSLDGTQHDLIAGNPDGDVTVVEFFDYNCGYCKATVDPLMQLIKEDKNVRIVLKEMPILDPSSVLATRAALASKKQGKYLPFHLALLDAQGGLNEANILEIAQSVGIDTAQLQRDMAADYIEDVIKANHQLAYDLGVQGTPGFIVGDELVPGAIDIDRMKELVKKARENCETC